MCFYNDCDWFASVVTNTVTVAAKPTRCYECGEIIPEGAWVRHIYQQEHEVCQNNLCNPWHDGPETVSEDCPPGCEHDFGQTYGYYRCQVCDQLIEAIHSHEIKEGCDEHESRPVLTQLGEAMHENGRVYLASAEAMYPGIGARLPGCYRRDEVAS